MVISPNYKATKPVAEHWSQYQAEVLNKCEGRPAYTKPPEWELICKVAWYVPGSIIMQALGKMQDERQWRLGLSASAWIGLALNDKKDAHTPVKDLTRYYFATVRSMCREHGVNTPIKWKE